ncbi:heavy-metal-associated domain-containing protein [Thermotoga caldifontis]|uniref:heavy-metal-associated domain-containing protein n=1 Tax=Thermotoga caldifontis TaxID=1508419 RepID=UPI00059750A8|nr:heavy-metal-associated domain-containing protein [Thermotoga caldifontis]
MRYELHVPDISCGHCRNRISKALEELGVKQYEIDVQAKKVYLDTDNVELVLKKLGQMGYPVESYRQL